MSNRKDLSLGETSVQKPVSSAGELAAFIAAAKSAPSAQGGRLILALDATMSRQPSWDLACALQGQMFAAAGRKTGLALQLVYFRGLGECRASRFVAQSSELARLMSGVVCQGGTTQIGKVFSHALKAHAEQKIAALVFIGDAMEENIDALADIAGRMGLHKIPAFMFQEGRDAAVETAYREFARLSGGGYFRFDRSAPGLLEELLKAIAVYATGGQAALIGNAAQGPKLLLAQLQNGARR
jgi:hypothetical protein